MEKEKEEGRKEEEGIMPSLVATTSALARTTCVSMHYVRREEGEEEEGKELAMQ